MLYLSHSPIKAASAERLIRIFRLLISRYCILRNTVAFIQDLDKTMLIYNQHPNRSVSDHSPFEVHHSDNILGICLKQYSSENVVKKKFNTGDTVRINRLSIIFGKGNYLWPTELF